MRIAIVGATGAVGVEMLDVLARQTTLPTDDVVALASPRSAGKKLPFDGRELEVQVAEPSAFEGVDLALFSAGGDTSKALAPAAVERGAIVVDNSSAFRMDDAVPLVVPEVNPQALATHHGIIANPNCSTIILVLALAPLARHYGLDSVIVSTYQAVSGAGAPAIAELRAQQQGSSDKAEIFEHPIHDNLIPWIDRLMDGGHSREELKMVLETRKILGLPDLSVRATCVRVPIERAHSESVSVHLRRPINPQAARDLFAETDGLVVEDDPAAHIYPMPINASGRHDVGVGRVRQQDRPDELDFFLCGDQLLKGAALNAVQIAEALYDPDRGLQQATAVDPSAETLRQ